VKSRPAKVGDRLRTTNFGTGTTGFGALDGDQTVAVCVLPGTEIAFDDPVAITTTAFGFKQTQHKLARFRQTNKNQPHMHHDVLEFPDGEQVLLTCLKSTNSQPFCNFRRRRKPKPKRKSKSGWHLSNMPR
jgi:hypothetical protein